jgi:uncharacterized protein
VLQLGKVSVVIAIASLIPLAGCNAKDKGMNELTEISSNVKKQLAFTCVHESDHIPPRDPEADQLYKHARWLIKKNILKKDPAAYPPAERLLRIATAYGHDRANIELRDMLDKGRAVSPDPVNESIDLVEDLIKRGIPAGYYDMGWYLEHGYGVRADKELAFKYYRKSADLGSPEGQYLVGNKLTDARSLGVEIAAVGWAMYRCSADQGYGKAAEELALHLQGDSDFSGALKYFQLAVSSGSSVAALSLSDAFGPKDHADPVFGLGQSVDVERQLRFKTVQRFLSDYSYLNPTILEIDQIVPLPPAKLPPWNGKFKWLDEHKADKAPPLPTEERIAEMARAKGLDPKTGRSVSGSPKPALR